MNFKVDFTTDNKGPFMWLSIRNPVHDSTKANLTGLNNNEPAKFAYAQFVKLMRNVVAKKKPLGQ